MDQRIIALESSTFSGRRLNRQQIADIQETVALLPNDSRNELAKTICEHLRWTTAKGRLPGWGLPRDAGDAGEPRPS